MWCVVLLFIGLIFILNNIIVPNIFNSFISSYIIQPILWIILIIITVYVAQKEGLNIWRFKKIRRWYLGRSPLEAGLITGGFHVSLLIIVGLFTGFGKSPYAFTLPSIIVTILYIGTFLLGTELTRAYFIKKGTTSKKYITLTLLLTTLLYVIFRLSYHDVLLFEFTVPKTTLEFIGKTLLVAISINLLASYLSYLGGATASISYMGILLAFEWFSPLLPDSHWTTIALIGTIAPAIGFIAIQNSFQERQKKHKYKYREKGQSYGVIVAIISIFLVFFSFGYLGVSPTIISSGSMQPALNVGDIAIIDEIKINEIEEGDIIQYLNFDNISFTIHRVINISKQNGELQFTTKGDANDKPDFKIVTSDRITGELIFTIPKIGLINIFINRIINNNN
jgi:signal peptidase I